MRPMTELELERVYVRRVCPFCGNAKCTITEGPRGGIMVNLETGCGRRMSIVHPEAWGMLLGLGEVLDEEEEA